MTFALMAANARALRRVAKKLGCSPDHVYPLTTSMGCTHVTLSIRAAHQWAILILGWHCRADKLRRQKVCCLLREGFAASWGNQCGTSEVPTEPFCSEGVMDLIVDLIDQLIEERVKLAIDSEYRMWNGDNKVAQLKERLRRVLAENIPNK